MAVPVVLSAEVQSVSSTTWTVTVPAGAGEGDLLYITFGANAGPGVLDLAGPTGWTQVFDSEAGGLPNGNAWQEAWYIILPAGHPSSYAFTPSVSRTGRAHVYVIDAGTFATSGTIEDVVYAAEALSDTAWDIPAVDAAGDALLIAAAACAGSGPTWTPDAAYTERTDAANGTSSSMGTGTRAITGGGTGLTATWTSSAGDNGTVSHVVIKGAAVGPPPPAPGSYEAEVEADTPIHWWRMGEASGNLVDSVGTAHGTSSGTVTRNVAGLINATDDDGAVDFGGGYFDLADAMALLDTTWSLEAWATVDSVTDGGYFLYFFDGADDGLSLGYNDAGRPFLRWDDGTTSRILVGPTPLAIGQLYHIVATHNGTTARLFVNGVEVAANTFASMSYGSMSSWTRRIGAPVSTGTFTHDGKGDEFIIYDHALTLERAQAHYLAGTANHFEGAGNFRAPAAQVVATGELTFAGAVVAFSDVPEVESSAEQVFTGTAIFHAPAGAFEGTGPDIDSAGVGVFHAPVPQLVGTGLIPYTGVGVFTAQPPQFEGTGFRSFVGAAIFHAPAATLEGTGAVTPIITTFSGVGTFHAPAATFTGHAVNAAVIREMLLYVDWDGTGFEPLDRFRLVSLRRTRGSGPFLNEQKPGSMTGSLENVDRLFTGEIGPLAGLIGPKARIWARYRFANVLYGIGSGYLSDLAAIPKTSTADFSTDDLLEHLSKIEVEIEPADGRTFGDYRLAILTAAGITAAQMDLAHEGDIMGEGNYGRGWALDLLEEINAATGSRHFVRTGITEETWAQYVVVDRWHKLDQALPDVEIDDIRHIERDSFSGWRTAWDTIVNRQSVSVTHPPTYDLEFETVWEADLPISVAASSTRVIWANNIGPVAEAELVIAHSGITASTLTVFADAAKIELTAGASHAVVTALSITGRPGTNGPATTVIKDDAVSQGIYGLREGPARTGVGLSETLAKGLAEHMVDRYGVPRRQPAVGMVDEKIKILGRDLFDIAAITASSVDVADRRMEIIGEELVYSSGDILTAQWQIQERPIQARSVVGIMKVGDPAVSI